MGCTEGLIQKLEGLDNLMMRIVHMVECRADGLKVRRLGVNEVVQHVHVHRLHTGLTLTGFIDVHDVSPLS